MFMMAVRKNAFSLPSKLTHHNKAFMHKYTRLSMTTSTTDPNHSKKKETTTESTSNAYRPGSLMAATREQGRVPYGEDSRKYRRTVFSHDDWVGHRNSEKILSNIQGMFFSGVIRQLREEITLITAVATFVVIWNDYMVQGVSLDLSSMGLEQVLHLPRFALPSLPFTLSSPALGLLLVFRTNASYGRWMEARNTWGKIIAQARNAVRMASSFSPQTEEAKQCIEDLSKAMWLLCRSLMNGLSGPEDDDPYAEEVQSVFADNLKEDKNIASYILKASKSDRTMIALAYASQSLEKVHVDEKRRCEADKSLVLIGDCIGVCEKLFTTPVPLVCK